MFHNIRKQILYLNELIRGKSDLHHKSRSPFSPTPPISPLQLFKSNKSLNLQMKPNTEVYNTNSNQENIQEKLSNLTIQNKKEIMPVNISWIIELIKILEKNVGEMILFLKHMNYKSLELDDIKVNLSTKISDAIKKKFNVILDDNIHIFNKPSTIMK